MCTPSVWRVSIAKPLGCQPNFQHDRNTMCHNHQFAWWLQNSVFFSIWLLLLVFAKPPWLVMFAKPTWLSHGIATKNWGCGNKCSSFLAMVPCVIPHNALAANEAPCNCLPQAHNAHSAHISKAEPWALPAVCHVVVPGLPPVVTLRGPGHTNQMRCTDLQGLLFHQMEPHPLSCWMLKGSTISHQTRGARCGIFATPCIAEIGSGPRTLTTPPQIAPCVGTAGGGPWPSNKVALPHHLPHPADKAPLFSNH